MAPDPSSGSEERTGVLQVEEDARRAVREQRKAADEYAGMLQAEFPDYDDDDDDVIDIGNSSR